MPLSAESKTSSGELSGRGETEDRAATAERLAAELSERAARVTGTSPARIEEAVPLTALGLDSLRAIELQQGLAADLGIDLPLALFLEGASLAELVEAALSAREQPARGGRIHPAAGAETGDHPASHGQRGLWFLHQMAPGSGAANIAVAARLLGAVDLELLQRCLAALVERHPALRTTFAAPGGEPVQRVHRHLPVDWQEEDAAGWGEPRLAERLAAAAWAPFDLAAGPLVRVRAFPGAPGGTTLVLAVHHSVADLWSFAVLVRELRALLAGARAGSAVPLPPLPLRYSDFARWQERMLAGPEGERLWAFWSARLAGSLPRLDLPADRPRPPLQTYRGNARALRLTPAASGGLRSLGRAQGTTLSVLLLAAWETLLHRHTGQEELCVGSPAAGRVDPALSGVVGSFVNPVVLRADLAGDPAWGELLARTRREMTAALEHQGYPFSLLAERLQTERDPARPPLFDTLFVFERAPADEPGVAAFALGEGGARLDLGGLEIESIALRERRVEVDLTLMAAAEAEEGLALSLQWNVDLFDPATAERLLGHLGTLLAALSSGAAGPERRLSELPLLLKAERWQLLGEWNATERDFPEGLCLHQLFEAQATRTPDAPALLYQGEQGGQRGQGERLTYAELDRAANGLAHHLRSLGVGPEARVGICLRRSPAMVVALLAVLKAGGAYVPLDPAYPAERLGLMCRDAGIAILLTRTGEGEGLPAPLLRIDLDAPEGLAGERIEPLAPLAGPGNLAYVIYTSGSTGRPKGCAIEHRSPVSLVHWAREAFSPAELSGVLAATSICFDLSVFEIFAPLSWGGTVILADNVLALPDLPERDRVTLVNTVPSALAELERLWGLPASVRTVCLAGEPLGRPLVERLYRHRQDGRGTVERVLNLYGPSEDTTYSTHSEVTEVAGGTALPPTIGRPLAQRRLYLLDRHLQPAPAGAVGEIHLGGAGLARGYLGRPDRTAERFLPDAWSGLPGARLYATGDLARALPTGEIALLGRRDHQVKVRGFRIELGEIEAALARHPGVGAAVVVAQGEGGKGDRRLVAYVTPAAGEEAPPPEELRRHLRQSLPEFMVPAQLVALPALPRTPSGKIDRRALPDPGTGGTQGPAGATDPRTPLENALLAIWRDVLSPLGRERIGIHDHFFDLGGHSLLAARLVARVGAELGVELTVPMVFATPTVAGLAQSLAAALPRAVSAAAPPLSPIPRGGPLPLSLGQEQLWLIDQLEPGTALYNMPAAVALAGDLDRAALKAALREIRSRHEILRTVFSAGPDGPVQVVLPAAASDGLPAADPFDLPLVDLAALPPALREAAADLLATAEGRRPFDLGRGPLVRCLLLRLGAAEHRLLLTLHHIVFDGASLPILVRELAALYGAALSRRPSPLPALALQYADYAVWQRRWLAGDVLAERLREARRRLAGLPALDLALDMALDLPGPRRTPRGGTVAALLPVDLTAAARRLARGADATLYMLLLAAFEALLQRYTGQPRFPVGTPVANRDRAETLGLLGFFANTLVLRAEVPAAGGFAALLAGVRELAVEAYGYQDLPFELLVHALAPERRSAVDNPLFQVLFVHQEPAAPLALPGLALSRLPVDTGVAKFDLTLATAEVGEGLEVALEYAADLASKTAAARLLGNFETLLAGALAEPGRPLSELPLLSPAERHQLARARHLSELRGSAEEDRTPPRTHVEEVLAGIWAALLGLPRVGIHGNFFALGGHSLLGTQVVSRVREAFAVDLALRQLFDRPTVATLAAAIEAARREEQPAAGPPLVPRAWEGREGRELPLSFAQERLWFLDRLEPGSPAYNMSGALLLRGRLEIAALAAAFRGVVERHETLRSRFLAVEGRPAVAIRPVLRLAVPIVDLAALPAEALASAARRLARAAARLPFDLAAGPLLRPALLRLGREEHLLLVSLHHIVADGWSLGVLTREIGALYGAAVRGGALPDASGSPLPPLPLQYADFAVWQRARFAGENLEQLLAYWRQQLAGLPAGLDLPADRPRPARRAPRGARRRHTLPAALADRLAELGRRQGGTLFMVLLAALETLLFRWSGQEDFAVGSPIAGRTRRELEDLIGLFVNTLVLRLRPAAGLPFAAALAAAREVTLGAYAHQELPFEKLVEDLAPERVLGKSPLFQVLLVLQNVPQPPLALPGLELIPVESESGAAKLDLTLTVQPTGRGLSLDAEYDPDLWDAPTMARFLRQLAGLLAAAGADPERRLAALPLLDAAERHQLVGEWNDSRRSFTEAEACLHELVQEQAARTPEAVAVEFAGERLTYRELDLNAGRLARRLRALGVGPEVPVGILAERSLELVVGLLGILAAGGAYLPLDPAHPRERLERMLADAGAPVLLAQPGLPALRSAARVVPLDLSMGTSAPGEEDPFREGGAQPGSLAYVLFTSGSTGRPKGAMNTHRGIVNRLLWMQEAYGLTPEDRVLQKTPATFDVSVWEFFWPLVTGARLVVARPGGHQEPAYLIATVATRGITTIHFVPALLQVFLEAPGVERCSGLARVVASGEALPAELAERFFARLPGVALHNLYGPTEAAVDVTAWACRPAGGRRPVPIGRPVANTRIHLLDPELRPVPVGVPGELYIGGVQVGRGYLGRPDLTAERFLPDPLVAPEEWAGGRLYRTGDRARHRPDGAIEFLGRLDQQVKIRGFRIELEEIEAALGGHPGLREAAVLVREDRPGDRRLVASVVPAGEEAPPAAELAAFLAATLPPYMIPTTFVAVAALPQLPSGKLDRRALAAAAPLVGWGAMEKEEKTEAEPAPPRTATEEVLAGLWAEVLGVERVGVDTSFFALGGHSLLAVQVLSWVESYFDLQVPLRQLFFAPTVAGLAAALLAVAPHPDQVEETARLLLEVSRLSDEEAGARLAAPAGIEVGRAAG
jgi:amino acid adenylation domain-containing protein